MDEMVYVMVVSNGIKKITAEKSELVVIDTDGNVIARANVMIEDTIYDRAAGSRRVIMSGVEAGGLSGELHAWLFPDKEETGIGFLPNPVMHPKNKDENFIEAEIDEDFVRSSARNRVVADTACHIAEDVFKAEPEGTQAQITRWGTYRNGLGPSERVIVNHAYNKRYEELKNGVEYFSDGNYTSPEEQTPVQPKSAPDFSYVKKFFDTGVLEIPEELDVIKERNTSDGD